MGAVLEVLGKCGSCRCVWGVCPPIRVDVGRGSIAGEASEMTVPLFWMSSIKLSNVCFEFSSSEAFTARNEY